MAAFYIIKAGTTYPDTKKRYGDFEDWTIKGLGVDLGKICILNTQDHSLPSAEDCIAVVVTGSHAMVTDEISSGQRISEWICRLVDSRVPFLGICYGHQLLAWAMGGEVGYHPSGEEIGTVGIHLLPECSRDPLFQGLPSPFYAHVTHEQTVLKLPPNAVRLAANDFENHHAIRIGDCAWGVQFHPEYDTDIMNAYIREQEKELEAAGRDVAAIYATVRDTPVATSLLRRFSELALKKRSGTG